MKFRSSELCRAVRLRLNHDIRYRPLVEAADMDTLTLDRLIMALAPDAAAEVEIAAPPSMLEGGYNFADSDLLKGPSLPDKRIYVTGAPLPADYMRLVSFKFSDWSMPVYSAIPPDGHLAALLQMPGAATLLSVSPIVMELRRPEGLVLMTYSLSNPVNTSVSEAIYRPVPVWDRDEAIEISSRLFDTVADRCAARAAEALARP